VSKLRVAVLFLALAATAYADWTIRSIRSTNSEPGHAGVQYEHVVLENGAGGQADVDLAIFSTKSCTLRVIDNQIGETLSNVMAREKCVAGVNGGYFSSNFEPIGLLISDGKIVTRLQRASLITGVLSASTRGVQILRPREFSLQKKVNAAVQCGPFLVDHYERVHGLNDSQLARRTFAAIATNDRALLGVCSEISLAKLAVILATTRLADDLKIQRALNLDGGSSSAFWFVSENGPFSILEQKSVRDFVAVVPK
jgi:Exopolysaccharide biosynthesis protein related to N-acetylglucosamine-1-phosphodiester alpha-N-acetylglucosaminidase